MNAINSINLSNTTSFKGSRDYSSMNSIKTFDKDDDFYSSLDTLQESIRPKKKGLIGTAISVAAAGLIIFGASKAGARYAAKTFESLPTLFEKGLSKASGAIDNVVGKLNNNDSKISGNLGKVIGKAADVVKTFYGKISSGDAEKGFRNTVGLTATAGLLPYVLTRDTNEDGVKDITQKGVNVYEGIVKDTNALKAIVNLVS